MKNYDELTRDLLKRRDCYVAAQRQKRITAVTALGCVCFVALLGLGLWKSGVFRATPPASIAGNPSVHSTAAPTTATLPTTTPTSAPLEITWVVNKVSNTVAAAKLNYNTPDYYSEKKDSAALAEYFGRDLSDLGSVMPDGFQYVGGSERTFFYKTDGTIAYDACEFLYRRGEERIAILAGKLRPPYDCLYMLDDPVSSYINGVELVIGEIRSDSGQLELVFADFSHDGIEYRVTIRNISSAEAADVTGWMVDVLAELIK